MQETQFLSKDNEPVAQERWQWVAVFSDGSELKQFDYDTVTYHYFGEIDHEKVSKFGLVNPQTGKRFLLDVPSGGKLIHFYDNIIQQHLGGPTVTHRMYCVGYENGKDKIIFTVLPNDFVVQGDPEKIGVM